MSPSVPGTPRCTNTCSGCLRFSGRLFLVPVGGEDRVLDEMWRLVQSSGERLADDDLSASDVVVPPSDLTLEETKRLFSDEGLIPDLPG